jgi:hypothetical protein
LIGRNLPARRVLTSSPAPQAKMTRKRRKRKSIEEVRKTPRRKSCSRALQRKPPSQSRLALLRRVI